MAILRQIQKANLKRKYKVTRQLEIGQRVYVKILVRRRKTDPRYVGPYMVKEILNRRRLRSKRVTGTRSRELIRHINEIRTNVKK